MQCSACCLPLLRSLWNNIGSPSLHSEATETVIWSVQPDLHWGAWLFGLGNSDACHSAQVELGSGPTLATVLLLSHLPGDYTCFYGHMDPQPESYHIHLQFEPLSLGFLFLLLRGALPHLSCGHSRVLFAGLESPSYYGGG